MNLTPYIEKIESAKNGNELRSPIAEVLNALYSDGIDADYLVTTDGTKLKAQDLSLKEDLKKILPVDSVPKKDSSKIVSSSGIFAAIGDLSTLEGSLPYE